MLLKEQSLFVRMDFVTTNKDTHKNTKMTHILYFRHPVTGAAVSVGGIGRGVRVYMCGGGGGGRNL